MTDTEIIENLECCMEGECEKCTYQDVTACKEYIFHDCLDLIARQKAEIERLKKIQQVQADRIVEERGRRYELAGTLSMEIKTAKSEAIREFAEKLKENLAVDCDRVCERSSLLCGSISGYPIYEVEDCIDNLVKERVGEDND